MAAHFIAAAPLGKINRALGLLHRAAGRVVGHDAGESTAHGDPSDLGKIELLHSRTKTFKRCQHQSLVRAVHENAKVLTAKAVNPVVRAKGIVHYPRNEQQDLLGNKMPMLVIDEGKVIDDG